MSTSKAKDASSKPADIRNFFGDSQSKSTPSQPAASGSSGMRRQSTQPIEISDDDEGPVNSKMYKKLNGMQLGSDTDMISEKSVASKGTSRKRKSTALILSSDEEEEESLPRKKAAVASENGSKPKAAGPTKSKVEPKQRNAVMLSDSSSEEEPVPKKNASTRKSEPKSKPKAAAVVESSDDEPAVKKAPTKKAPPATKAKAEPKSKSNPKKDTESQEAKPAKPNFAAIMAKRSAGPIAPGSKEIPVGEPNCLAGLTFVFTGELDSLSREEASDLAKRYGGRVTGAPSRVTSYVVLGTGAGPKKLEVIKKQNLKTLNEDQFLELIGTREAVLDDKTIAKMKKEDEKMKKDAEEMVQRELKVAKSASKTVKPSADPTSQLWTTKYAPQSVKEICGNKSNVEKVQSWLHDWQDSRKGGFKHAGKHALNQYRALLLYGAPGLGKTTTAHLCAKLEGYTPIELNASDARSKKLVENATNINNTSLDGWFASKEMTNTAGVVFTDKSVLIMDEVDGMSAGDRGGVVALKALIKKTQIPIICIANDAQSQKLKPLAGVAAFIHFTRPPAAQVKSRIATICYKEKMNIPPNVMEQLITGAQSDIRQILNMLSTWKLSKGSMDFEESKELVQANQKYTIMTPFNCTSKVLGPYLFSKTSRETLGEKMELYFHEPSLMPLFIQENYLKQNPARANTLSGPDYELKVLELMQGASSSISDADLVDSMLRGSEQHWSLMPLHSCLSLVRPASFMYGSSVGGAGAGGGYSYKDSAAFPQWLGQNSKQSKLQRALGDVQAKMRMKVSGDKTEIRRHYIPALVPHLVDPLADKDRSKEDAVKEVIGVMDEYYLNKEDWDTLVELGVGARKDETILKTVPTATKTAFTRAYNSSEHPVAFHKGTDLGAPIKRLAKTDVPDLEEAFDIEDEVLEEDEEEAKPKAKNTAINDKLVKEKKPKAAGQKSAKVKAKSEE